MFEKEAEEYAEKVYGSSTEIDHYGIADAFQDGAEFGYNKCKEELNQKGLALQSDMDKTIEQNIALKKELEKANEWHYPSKGELPKCDEKTQLIFYVNCYYEIEGETITRKRTVLGYYQNSFLNDDIKLFVEKSKGYEDEHLPKDIIAWKEIVLPKESE